MRFRFHLLLALLAACALLATTSCNKDKDEDPAPNNNDNNTDTTGNQASKPKIQLIFALPADGSTVLDQSPLRIKFRADKGTSGPNLVSFKAGAA